jgi:PII-like signaling protein
MKGIYINFFVTERAEHEGILLYVWLLQQARKLGLHGGTAVRGVAGFGRHGKMHEQSFFELAPDLPVEVNFIATEPEVEKLLAAIESAGLKLLYTRDPVEFGITGEPR